VNGDFKFPFLDLDKSQVDTRSPIPKGKAEIDGHILIPKVKNPSLITQVDIVLKKEKKKDKGS
jgi:hypothetical protein